MARRELMQGSGTNKIAPKTFKGVVRRQIAGQATPTNRGFRGEILEKSVKSKGRGKK